MLTVCNCSNEQRENTIHADFFKFWDEVGQFFSSSCAHAWSQTWFIQCVSVFMKHTPLNAAKCQ